ncbi:DNA single-strand annealing protein, ERF superfamily [Campylobacter vicugnae]|uniref:DNA single-strand annealing protein, ERF superfamily n=1 Tax=Campylobacter vicugnae TaxID=1660076 RepID=A0A1X9T0Z9_9BACT|nr:ERF family protein [Campylobacter sp. RM8964]ARR02188.1 DNA single-strand annealing protein, ERF superfamily [Campylobacter sp. RM8964]
MLELLKIQTELKAPKTQFNKFGGYQYRSCEDIVEALKPLQEKYKCVVLLNDELVIIGDRYYIRATATIINEKGDKLSVSALAREPENKKGMDESQITGSSSSYARKYALNGLFAIDDTKDADATNTHDKEPSKNQKQILTLTLEQKRDITELLEATNTDLNKFLDFFKVYSIDNVPYDKAFSMLTKKLNQNKGEAK